MELGGREKTGGKKKKKETGWLEEGVMKEKRKRGKEKIRARLQG